MTPVFAALICVRAGLYVLFTIFRLFLEEARRRHAQARLRRIWQAEFEAAKARVYQKHPKYRPKVKR